MKGAAILYARPRPSKRAPGGRVAAACSDREMDHVAFTVKGTYGETLARLDEHGIEVETRPGDSRCIYVDDPDGHHTQILAAGG